MQILMNSGGIAMTSSFVIADEQAKLAVMFDAPDHTTEPLLDQIEQNGWDLVGLWLTHGHFDHVADHAVVTKRFPNAKLLMHRLDEPKLQNPNVTRFELPFSIPPRSADEYVEEGQKLKLGSLEFAVLFTPGHAPGHVMYHLAKEKVLVGGDLIIGGAVGRTDLFDSDPEELEESVRRVMKLPDETQLLPGHGSPGTLGDERRTNLYVRTFVRQGK